MASYDSYNGGDGTANNDFDGSKTLAALGWTDLAGGVYGFAGNLLTGSVSGGNDWQTKLLLRPASEDSLTSNELVVFDSMSMGSQGLVARFQRGGANNTYFFASYDKSGAAAIYARDNGSFNPSPYTASFNPVPSGHSWAVRLFVRPNPTAGTDLTLTAYDLTSGNTLGTFTVTNNTASLQSAGGVGLTGWAGSLAAQRIQVATGASPRPVYRVANLGIKIIPVGNSITFGYKVGGGQIDHPYPADLQTFLGAGYTVTNRGFSGQDLDTIFSYNPIPNRGIASPYIDRLPQQNGYTPQITGDFENLLGQYTEVIVLLMEGTNSLVHSDVAYGANPATGQTNDDMRLRYKQAIADLRVWAAMVGVAIQIGLLTTIATQIPNGQNSYETRRITFNDANRADATTFLGADFLVDVALITVGGVQIFNSQTATTNGTYYGTDGVHPVDAGAAQIAQAVQPAVTLPTVSSVTLTPSTATIPGNGTQQFAAQVNGSAGVSQSGTWAANLGTITQQGLYTAPAPIVGQSQTDIVTFTPTADQTKSGAAAVTIPAKEAGPVFAPASGATITQGGTFSLSDSDSQASIRYTLDGTAPTGASPLYSGPVALPNVGTIVVKAFAQRSGQTDSDVSVATYTVGAPPQPTTPSAIQYIRALRLVIDRMPGDPGATQSDVIYVGDDVQYDLDLTDAAGTPISGEGCAVLATITPSGGGTPISHEVATEELNAARGQYRYTLSALDVATRQTINLTLVRIDATGKRRTFGVVSVAVQ